MQYYVKKLSRDFPGTHTLNGNTIKTQEVPKHKLPKKEFFFFFFFFFVVFFFYFFFLTL